MNMGDTLSSSENSEVFFGVTKLFQSTDVNLRRMMYLFIKEVSLFLSCENASQTSLLLCRWLIPATLTT